jgi:hypothetical protein
MLVKNKHNCDVSLLADGTQLTPYLFLKMNDPPKETLPTGNTCRCNEKGQVTDEL